MLTLVAAGVAAAAALCPPTAACLRATAVLQGAAPDHRVHQAQGAGGRAAERGSRLAAEAGGGPRSSRTQLPPRVASVWWWWQQSQDGSCGWQGMRKAPGATQFWLSPSLKNVMVLKMRSSGP